MGLFGKKKNNEEQPENSAENKSNSNISDEMKIILAAREEAQQEKKAKAEERQQAQEKADKEEDLLEEQARMAAEKVLTGDATPAGMTFYVICDEVDVGAAPETEGNLIVRGIIRGTVKSGSEVFLYQGSVSRTFLDAALGSRADDGEIILWSVHYEPPSCQAAGRAVMITCLVLPELKQ